MQKHDVWTLQVSVGQMTIKEVDKKQHCNKMSVVKGETVVKVINEPLMRSSFKQVPSSKADTFSLLEPIGHVCCQRAKPCKPRIPDRGIPPQSTRGLNLLFLIEGKRSLQVSPLVNYVDPRKLAQSKAPGILWTAKFWTHSQAAVACARELSFQPETRTPAWCLCPSNSDK